jgi:hypothetical protein
LIATVVIESFKRHSFWAIAHVGNEVGERLPSLADDYPSASVVFVMMMPGVLAPGFHAGPNGEHLGFALSVQGALAAKHFKAQATAA